MATQQAITYIPSMVGENWQELPRQSTEQKCLECSAVTFHWTIREGKILCAHCIALESPEEVEPPLEDLETLALPANVRKNGKSKGKLSHRPADKRHEIKMALAEWRLTPDYLRVPQTLRELAKKLGIHVNTLAWYDKRTPKGPQEFLDAVHRGALASYWPEAVDAIGRKAAKGNVEAYKAFAKSIVEPIQQAQPGSPLKNQDLQAAVGIMFQQKGVALTATKETTKTTVQTEPAIPDSGSV